MNNKEIEKMLYDARNHLPTTNTEWRISDMAEERYGKKRLRFNKTAAVIALVFMLGLGGGTALANMEMDIDPGEYGQWVDISSCNNWMDCELQMENRGFTLPEKFGEYEFHSFSTYFLAKHGTTYLDALLKNVYNPISITFDDNLYEKEADGPIHGMQDGYCISVSAGTLEEAYWSAYYEFQNVDGTWVYSGAETSFEYEGITVYGELKHFESSDDMNWRWIDEKNGVCWSVYVSVNTGMDNEIDSQEVVKEIIELNK